MADDVQITAGSGTTIATDDIGSGRQVQLMKPVFGADGSATMVSAGSGLPAASDWKELSGSVSSNNANLFSSEVAGYTWISVQFTGTWSAAVQIQQSNDNTNWLNCETTRVETTVNGTTSSATSTGLYASPINSRYIRARTISFTSGTVVATAIVSSSSPSTHLYPYIAAIGNAISISSGSVTSPASDGVTGQGIGAPALVYNGANWTRLRSPATFKTVATQASGNTALWQPGASNRWRLQCVMVQLSGDAAMSSGGVLTIDLRDGSTSINVTLSPYVPAIGGTLVGGWSSGWIDLGNGIQSAANNQDLNVNLSAALTAGFCRVVACGTQGAGTAA